MAKFILTFLLVGATGASLLAQSVYAPLNEDYYHLIDRYEIKTGKIYPQIFTGIKPYKRADIVSFVDSVLLNDNVFQFKADQFNYDYLKNDSWEWSQAETSDSQRPILSHFYRKKSDLFHVNNEDFDLHINPVLYVGLGKDEQREDRLFINTRGVEIRGMIDKKVGFYTYLTDNQAILPSYVWSQMALNPVIPHEGFWKEYKEGKGVDFLQARAYITFNATKHIDVQFGHDNFFIGNGNRSLIFSDYAPPALFLKTNLRIWKVNYVFSLNRMIADAYGTLRGLHAADRKYPEKFIAFHQASINIGKKLNISVFESVIFSPKDSVNNNSFELSYLNPVIFYRAVEQQNGSSDNVILGADFKWNAFKNISLYGQFILDEFVIKNIRAGNGWWANKFGIQGGIKYIDAFGIPNLDLQAETNWVRPYTYSHNTAYGNYSSYRQPVAHPLGANFKEVTGILRYQPLGRLNVVGKLSMMQVGRDTTGVNWGGDVLKDNRTKQQEYENTIAQGVKNNILFGSLTLSWQLKHNLFIDVNHIIRRSESPVVLYNYNTSITSLALRWNISKRLYEF